MPVREIAAALDIGEIREEPLTNFEAALITTPERGYGSILVNLNSSRRRRRYSIGHELLHFLNPWHRPTSPGGFECSRLDMIETGSHDRDLHRRQEAEANTFAIELLAPAERVRGYMADTPDLAEVIAMADDLDISREAAARRYVSLHDEGLTVLFVDNGLLRYSRSGTRFPRLCIDDGRSVPAISLGPAARTLSSIEEVDPEDWLRHSDGILLWAQILHQRNGFATILLRASGTDDEDDPDIDDAFERLTDLGAR